MPVVINEFEVVDTPPGTPAAAGAAPPPAQQPLADEEDLRRLLAEIAEHTLRLWSH